MTHISGLILFTAIGLLPIIAFIGVLIYLTRNNLISGTNKIIAWVIGISQAVHAALFLTGVLAIISNANIYVGFAICAFLSLICLSLSVWLILPFSKFYNAIKYLFLFFAFIQVLATIVIFLLPDMGGFPALIQF